MFSLARKTAFAGVLFFALLCFWPAVKKDHYGPAKVVDFKTLKINGETHKLFGLMPHPACATAECGKEAADALVKFLNGRPVACAVQQKNADNDNQFISICYVGSDNVGAWIVENGWAGADHTVDRLRTFVNQEGMARFVNKGLWKRMSPAERMRPQ
jgi:endonuclease YncB( thermonuclease family)